MSYTQKEITNIKQLAASRDYHNCCLAVEFCRARGLVQELLTPVYWIYNRCLWQDDVERQRLCWQLLYNCLQPTEVVYRIVGIFSNQNGSPKTPLRIHEDFTTQAQRWQLDLEWLALRIARHWSDPRYSHSVRRFLFEYGDAPIRKAIIPQLKSKNNTGVNILNLGGLGLKEVPEDITEENEINHLFLSENELTALPDFWEKLPALKALFISNNHIKQLPPSFSQLKKLERLHAHNNPLDAEALEQVLLQLPKLKRLYLGASRDKKEDRPYARLETLVNNNQLHASTKEKLLTLAWHLEDEEAIAQLTLKDWLKALGSKNFGLRSYAKHKVLTWNDRSFDGQLSEGASVAVLGLVSFHTRQQTEAPNDYGIAFTDAIEAETTHILLGDDIEVTDSLLKRPFVFLSEKDFLALDW